MLTIGADDLLFYVMNELTFSYLGGPASKGRGERQSQNLVPRFASYQKLKRLLISPLYFCEKLWFPPQSEGAIANVCTDLLWVPGEETPC